MFRRDIANIFLKITQIKLLKIKMSEIKNTLGLRTDETLQKKRLVNLEI